jgi:alpha-D-ribose 1-methylphosphonate 5-triphosphate synthase subunit PhnH
MTASAQLDVNLPGFADPVEQAQATFRAVLDAVARPGTLVPAGQGLTPPAPLDPATAAVLLTLVDHDTALWLDLAAGWAVGPARDWIAFHCGSGFTAHPERAAFALALELPDLARLSPGTHEQPETAATLILQVHSLTEGARYRLRGPGLRASNHLAVRGLPADFVAIWQRNRAGFPLGVDLVLCAGTTLAALPRSVTVEAD